MRGKNNENKLEKIEVISQPVFLETYKTKKIKRLGSGRISIWNDANFKNALKLAKENPNSWILFNKFQCSEGIYAQKNHERHKIKWWFKRYKKTNMLDNYFLEVRQKDSFELAFLSYQQLGEEE